MITCDRLPRDLGALEDRLRERFEAGLVTDIEPPDLTHAPRRSCASAPSTTASTLADDGVLPTARRPRATTTSARSRAR